MYAPDGHNDDMRLYEDEIIVLRTMKLGEADRIITALGRSHGKIRAVAKGVRKPTSRFGGRLEPFMVVTCQFRKGRSLDIISSAVTSRPYAAAIARDYGRFRAGTVVLETADRLSQAEPSLSLYLLLRGAVGALARGAHDPELIRDSFTLRALAAAGWGLELSRCVQCGAEGEWLMLAPLLGGVLCDTCRPAGALSLSGGSRDLLVALASGNWDVADQSVPADRLVVSGIVATYLQNVIEHRINSLG